MDEIWHAIPDYEGFYEASSLGRIRSLDRVVHDHAGKPRRRNGQILRQFTQNARYLVVSLRRDGRKHDFLVHRVVLAAFAGPCPPGMECCHNDGNRMNNRVENLRWDTRKANHFDKRAHGTAQRSTHCPRGHALVEPNLVLSALKNDARECLACSRGAAFIRNAERDGRPHGTLAQESDRYHHLVIEGNYVDGRGHNRDRIHCSQGHLFEPWNLTPSALKKGRRACLACSRARAFIYEACKRGEAITGTLAEVSAPYYAELQHAATSS